MKLVAALAVCAVALGATLAKAVVITFPQCNEITVGMVEGVQWAKIGKCYFAPIPPTRTPRPGVTPRPGQATATPAGPLPTQRPCNHGVLDQYLKLVDGAQGGKDFVGIAFGDTHSWCLDLKFPASFVRAAVNDRSGTSLCASLRVTLYPPPGTGRAPESSGGGSGQASRGVSFYGYQPPGRYVFEVENTATDPSSCPSSAYLVYWVAEKNTGPVPTPAATAVPTPAGAVPGSNCKYGGIQGALLDKEMTWIAAGVYGLDWQGLAHGSKRLYCADLKQATGRFTVQTSDRSGVNLCAHCRLRVIPPPGSGLQEQTSSAGCDQTIRYFAPPNIPAGRYLLWVEDMPGGETCQQQFLINWQFYGPPKTGPGSAACKDGALTQPLSFAANTFGYRSVGLPRGGKLVYCANLPVAAHGIDFGTADMSGVSHCARVSLKITPPAGAPGGVRTSGAGDATRSIRYFGTDAAPMPAGQYIFEIADANTDASCTPVLQVLWAYSP